MWLKTLENGSSEISGGAQSWKMQSRIRKVEHQAGITGRELRIHILAKDFTLLKKIALSHPQQAVNFIWWQGL